MIDDDDNHYDNSFIKLAFVSPPNSCPQKTTSSSFLFQSNPIHKNLIPYFGSMKKWFYMKLQQPSVDEENVNLVIVNVEHIHEHIKRLYDGNIDDNGMSCCFYCNHVLKYLNDIIHFYNIYYCAVETQTTSTTLSTINILSFYQHFCVMSLSLLSSSDETTKMMTDHHDDNDYESLLSNISSFDKMDVCEQHLKDKIRYKSCIQCNHKVHVKFNQGNNILDFVFKTKGFADYVDLRSVCLLVYISLFLGCYELEELCTDILQEKFINQDQQFNHHILNNATIPSDMTQELRDIIFNTQNKFLLEVAQKHFK